MVKWATAALAIVIVSGCTVGPDYRLPRQAMINNPASKGRFATMNRMMSANEPPDDWWRLYNDPVLNRLIQQSLAANTDLRVAEANLEKSVALAKEAHAVSEPDFGLNASSAYTQRSAEAYVHKGEIPANQLYDLGLSVSYDLDLFGRLQRGIEAASADADAALAMRDLVRINVVASTAQAYVDVCNMGRELAVARRAMTLRSQTMEIVQKLVRSGRDSRLALEQQQTLVRQIEATFAPLQARRRAAVYRLATLAGRPPAIFDSRLTRCETPPELTKPLPTGNGATLLARRPDVRAAERRLAAATAQIGVATATLYPNVRLGASIGSTGAVPDFLSSLTSRYSAGPSISWELNQSVSRARIAGAKANARAALARFDGTVLTALRETEIALDQYARDLDRRADMQAARDRAALAAADVQTLLKGGRADALTTLEAQRTLVEEDQALAVVDAHISDDQIAIFLALGGGWQTFH